MKSTGIFGLGLAGAVTAACFPSRVYRLSGVVKRVVKNNSGLLNAELCAPVDRPACVKLSVNILCAPVVKSVSQGISKTEKIL